MSPKLSNFISTIFLLFMGMSTYAQKGPPPPDTRDPSLPGLVAPIDENLIFLVAAGLVVGIYHVFKMKRARINTPE